MGRPSVIYNETLGNRIDVNGPRLLNPAMKEGLARSAAFVSRLNQSSRCLHTIAGITVLAYVLLYVNLLTFVFPGAGHDDGRFMTHAYSIASGKWLGPYSQFTLMKGPGYPIFLAFLSLFRIPVTLAHAMFWGSSVWLLSYTTFRLFRSGLLSVFVLEVVIWNFGPHSMRVIRDEIATPQILMVFSCLLLCLFILKGAGTIRCAVLSGLLFGWFWITREEGILTVPAIGILFVCAFQKGYTMERRVKGPVTVLAAFLLSFVIVLFAIALTNFKVYGTFVLVDINGPFKSALEELESVRPDIYVPYLSVSKNSREKIYKVSPTFAQLRPLIEDPKSPIRGYSQVGCGYYPTTCGDYAAGWFLWGLRDAVAFHGDYSSPRASSKFYIKVHDEVKSACESGKISCYHNLLPFMPHISESQLLQGGSKSLKLGIKELSLIEPPGQLNDANSIGSDDQVRAASQFLGIEIHTPPATEPDAMVNHGIINFAIKQRRSLIRIYRKWLPRLLLLGLLSFSVVAFNCIYSKSYSVGFAIASAAWVAVACRIVALTLIDISSFPAMFHMYVGYAYSFACYASLVSIFLLGNLILAIYKDKEGSAIPKGLSSASVALSR